MDNTTTYKRNIQFQLRDLIVLVLLAAVAMALVVQWIIPAREAARRDACQVKMMHLGNGLISFASAYLAFPHAAPSCTTDAWHSTGIEAGQYCVGPNWAISILGQMDDATLSRTFHREVDLTRTCSMVEFNGAELGSQVPDFMLCPSSVVANALHDSDITKLDNLAKGNYSITLGSSTYLHSIENNQHIEELLRGQLSPRAYQEMTRSRGVCTVRMIPGWQAKYDYRDNHAKGIWLFAYGKGTKVADISDGTGHTVLLSEVLPFDTKKAISDDIRGVWVSASMGASTYSHLTTPNSKTPDSINGCDTAATGQLKCVQIQPGTDQEGDTFAAARSQHLRGVNVVFADGSSKFITDDVDPKIWRALATRAGGDNDEMMSSGP